MDFSGRFDRANSVLVRKFIIVDIKRVGQVLGGGSNGKGENAIHARCGDLPVINAAFVCIFCIVTDTAIFHVFERIRSDFLLN